MIAAVKGNHFLLELVILILPVEGVCRVFVERVAAWSRDATILDMGCVGGFHNSMIQVLCSKCSEVMFLPETISSDEVSSLERQ